VGLHDVVEANVLVYTLWSEWAQCNVCGTASGERRRTGSSAIDHNVSPRIGADPGGAGGETLPPVSARRALYCYKMFSVGLTLVR